MTETVEAAKTEVAAERNPDPAGKRERDAVRSADARIAVELFGLQVRRYKDTGHDQWFVLKPRKDGNLGREPLADYHADPAAMMAVIGKLESEGNYVQPCTPPLPGSQTLYGSYLCRIVTHNDSTKDWEDCGGGTMMESVANAAIAYLDWRAGNRGKVQG